MTQSISKRISKIPVRFSADQAPYVRERQWHPTQKLRDLRDGRVELTFRAGGTFEIIRWILGWGDAAKVIRPARLQQAVRATLRRGVALYSRRSRSSSTILPA